MEQTTYSHAKNNPTKELTTACLWWLKTLNFIQIGLYLLLSIFCNFVFVFIH